MDMDSLVKSLHPLEVRLIYQYEPGRKLSAAILAKELDYKTGQANQAFSWLVGKGLAAEAGREPRVLFELTETGRQAQAEGLPEERLLKVVDEGAFTLPELAARLGLEQKDLGSAFGALSKEGVLTLDAEKRAHRGSAASPRLSLLRALVDRAAAAPEGQLDAAALSADEQTALQAVSKKRGAADSLFRMLEREEVFYTLGAEVPSVRAALKQAGITGEELGALTPQMLESGSWRGKTFRPFNIQSSPARLLLGRRNPYQEYLLSVKDKLVSLGFEEFDGPLVETEFWNGDALFMPQFHSARDIHDVYYVKNPTHATEIEQPWLDNVAAAHTNGGKTGSRGWGYEFDRDFTRRLILRSQGTVLSAKQLPKAKIPGKYFGVARCFRYDQVDATHGADFYQTEGIVLGEDVNLRTLLGLLKMFAEEVAGATEVKYVPGYFPFTEPSIEVHIKHPVLGWFELGGSGIFRPEVTEPLGIKVPVLAWGLGIDRMALMQLGLNDLRELFTPDIEKVRLRRRS